MFYQRKNYISGNLLAVITMALMLVLYSLLPAIASDDHDQVRELKNQGEILALSELISKAGLKNLKILEAELEREHGKLIYEVEFLDPEGRVFEQYFDAITGEAITDPGSD